jgi:hypothetical protein
MDFLVMLEDPAESAPLARVDSVPEGESASSAVRDVVTLYGTPRVESLALALAAAVESHRRETAGTAAMHLGLWPERGAVGDAAWRDGATGELITRDLAIPLDVLTATADQLVSEFGALLRKLVAGLAMPDWPEGAWRAISLTLPRPALAGAEGTLDDMRQADQFTFDYEDE